MAASKKRRKWKNKMLIFHKNGIILMHCQSPIPFNQNWKTKLWLTNITESLMHSGNFLKRCNLHYIIHYITLDTLHYIPGIIILSCGGCKSRTLLDNTLQLCLHRLRSSFHICMNVAPNLQSVIRSPTSDHQSNFFSFELISLFIMTNKKPVKRYCIWCLRPRAATFSGFQ